MLPTAEELLADDLFLSSDEEDLPLNIPLKWRRLNYEVDLDCTCSSCVGSLPPPPYNTQSAATVQYIRIYISLDIFIKCLVILAPYLQHNYAN